MQNYALSFHKIKKIQIHACITPAKPKNWRACAHNQNKNICKYTHMYMLTFNNIMNIQASEHMHVLVIFGWAKIAYSRT